MHAWKHYVFVMLFFIVTVVCVRISIVNVSWVESGSMLPNYAVQDRLLVNQLAWGLNILFAHTLKIQWNSPDRGDIVLFHHPYDGQKIWMKRVIAVAGDRVAFHDHQLWINGKACVIDQQRMEYLPRKDHQPAMGHRIWFSWLEADWSAITVPAGHLFVMGDNRGASNDSRHWGTLEIKQLTGQPWLKLWSMATR